LTAEAAFAVAGARLVACGSGILWWPAHRLLAVADLHLEKGSAIAARGRFLPPYDTRATLERLEACIAAREPAHVVCLGDSFHDKRAASRLSANDRERLSALVTRQRWTWIEGNHDPLAPEGLGGEATRELRIGPLTFRHEAATDRIAAGEISGHYHPKAIVLVRGRALHARCFATDGRRLVLPAFGAYAGGLNVLDEAMRPLFAEKLSVYALSRGRVHAIDPSRLAGD
jgi:uncharacterized protein